MSAPVPTIETARLRLRPWRAEDVWAYRSDVVWYALDRERWEARTAA